jgi:hypothetical protein
MVFLSMAVAISPTLRLEAPPPGATVGEPAS